MWPHAMRPGAYSAAGAAALCIWASACASQMPTAAERLKWCGVGGGAAIGALTPPTFGVAAVSGNNGGGPGAGYVVLLGLMLAPVGALVGAIDGAVNNPCPADPLSAPEPVTAGEPLTPAAAEATP